MEKVSAENIRVATSTDRPQLVNTVVAAFADDPAFRFFFPTQEIFASEAPLFVGALFDHRVDAGATWILDGADGPGGTAASLAMWSPPDLPSHGADLSGLSPDTIARLVEYDEATSTGLPSTPFWYLGILATHPDYLGQRLGRALMKPGQQAAMRSQTPAYLETTNPHNVAMYERAGWSTTATNKVRHIDVTVLRHKA